MTPDEHGMSESPIEQAKRIVDAFHAKFGKDKRIAILPSGTTAIVQATQAEMDAYERDYPCSPADNSSPPS